MAEWVDPCLEQHGEREFNSLVKRIEFDLGRGGGTLHPPFQLVWAALYALNIIRDTGFFNMTPLYIPTLSRTMELGISAFNLRDDVWIPMVHEFARVFDAQNTTHIEWQIIPLKTFCTPYFFNSIIRESQNNLPLKQIGNRCIPPAPRDAMGRMGAEMEARITNTIPLRTLELPSDFTSEYEYLIDAVPIYKRLPEKTLSMFRDALEMSRIPALQRVAQNPSLVRLLVKTFTSKKMRMVEDWIASHPLRQHFDVGNDSDSDDDRNVRRRFAARAHAWYHA